MTLLEPTTLRDAIAAITFDAQQLAVTVDGERLQEATPRDLRQVLSGHLYTHWHIGRADDADAEFYRDAAFEETLIEATPVRTTRRRVSPPVDADIVELDGVRVRVPADCIDFGADGSAVLTLPSVRPSLSPGFLLVDGSRGRPQHVHGLVRVYLSIESKDDAPVVWREVLIALEALGCTYRAKVGSSDRLFPRTDAMVVYLPAAALQQWRVDRSGPVATIAAAAGGTGLLAPSTSMLAHAVATGVAIAEEPSDPRSAARGMSFGQHRCYAIATGVLGTADGDMVERVRAAMRAASIDPDIPAYNLIDDQGAPDDRLRSA